MTLEVKQLIEILNTVKPQNSSTETLEEIKKCLEEQDSSVYQKWKESGFDINYLFEEKNNEFTLQVSLLILAAAHSESVMVSHLVDQGANVNNKNSGGITALHIAAVRGHLETVKYLVEKGADVNIAEDNDGVTALHMSTENGHLEIVKYLVEKGADVNIADNNGETALYWAAKKGHLEIAKYLVEKGTDVNIADNNGKTALHWAAKKGNLATIKALLEKGADVNIADNDGETALHWSAENGHLEIVKYLVENGANVNIASKVGWTPLHCVAQSGRMDLVEFLLNKGANPSLKNIFGRAPRDLANNENVKQRLEKAEAANKALKIGMAVFIVTGLALFLVGSAIAGLQSVLVVALVAVASIIIAREVGSCANLIAYSALKPSDNKHRDSEVHGSNGPSSKVCETMQRPHDVDDKKVSVNL